MAADGRPVGLQRDGNGTWPDFADLDIPDISAFGDVNARDGFTTSEGLWGPPLGNLQSRVDAPPEIVPLVGLRGHQLQDERLQTVFKTEGPTLGPGWVYMGANDDYLEHLVKYVDEDEPLPLVWRPLVSRELEIYRRGKGGGEVPAECKRAQLQEEWDEENQEPVEEGNRVFITRIYHDKVLAQRDAANEGKGEQQLDRSVFEKDKFDKLPARKNVISISKP
ncbi:hypothetical protein C8R46DRAFT_1214084 [Mycena filopes]|nr:hypothetical protein C8R46DRAFT_1214084 [Mycena filopes]